MLDKFDGFDFNSYICIVDNLVGQYSMTTHFETMDRERVFLTGATGFIGYNIALELLASGYRVRILVRKSNPFPDNSIKILSYIRKAVI